MKVVVTGGGTMGHITPAMMIINELRSKGVRDFCYLGNGDKMEKDAAKKNKVPFVAIDSKGMEGIRQPKMLQNSHKKI